MRSRREVLYAFVAILKSILDWRAVNCTIALITLDNNSSCHHNIIGSFGCKRVVISSTSHINYKLNLEEYLVIKMSLLRKYTLNSIIETIADT